MAFQAALNMDVSGFSSGISKAASGITSLANTVKGLAIVEYGGKALGAMADVVGGAFKGMYSAMEAGGALVDLSEQTGLAVDKLMVLQTAFQQAGLGAEEVQPVVNKMQKAIETAATEGGTAATAFDKLGLSVGKLSGMNAEEQLSAVGEAISKIQNPTQKAAAAMEIFGKSGGKMLALFASGGLDDAAAAVGKQAQIMKDNAGVFDKVTDILGTAATKLQGLYVGIASKVAPMLLEAVEAFNSVDLSGLGEQIGTIVSVVLEAFSTGVLGQLTLESMKYAFVWAVNFVSSALAGVFSGILQTVVSTFSIITSADFWGGVLTALVGAAQEFIAILADGVAGILDEFATLPGIGDKAGGAAKTVRNYAGEVRGRSQDNLISGLELIQPMINGMSMDLKGAVVNAANAAPQMAQSTAIPDLISKLQEGAAARQEKVRQENPFKEKDLGGELSLNAQKGQAIGDFSFASSMAKIGGSQFGPAMDTGTNQLAVSRQQLEEQRKMSQQQGQSNTLLKQIAEAKGGNATWG